MKKKTKKAAIKKTAKKVSPKKTETIEKKVVTTTTTTVTKTTTLKKNPTETHYLLILDESGSMESVRQQTLDGLNEQIQSINKLEKQYPNHKYFINILKFDDAFRDLVVNTKASEVRKFTLEDYKPHASTALRDAIGLGVTKLNGKIEEKINSGKAKALVVILTDGQENASIKFSPEEIKGLITKLDATQSWTFTFIGANQDSVTTANSYGIHSSNVANYSSSSIGTRTAFAAVSAGMANVASGYANFVSGADNRAFMSSVLQDNVNIGEDSSKLNIVTDTKNISTTNKSDDTNKAI